MESILSSSCRACLMFFGSIKDIYGEKAHIFLSLHLVVIPISKGVADLHWMKALMILIVALLISHNADIRQHWGSSFTNYVLPCCPSRSSKLFSTSSLNLVGLLIWRWPNYISISIIIVHNFGVIHQSKLLHLLLQTLLNHRVDLIKYNMCTFFKHLVNKNIIFSLRGVTQKDSPITFSIKLS